MPTPGIGIVAANEAVTTRLGIDGVVIVQAQPGSPAARAGLIGVNMSTGDVGDVIVEADGKPIKRLSDLTEEIERIGVGKQRPLTVSRNGQRRDVSTEIVDIGSRALKFQKLGKVVRDDEAGPAGWPASPALF